jgi:hypothetical protein
MVEVGHSSVETRFLAHTTLVGVSSAAGSHPHRRLISSPLDLQLSHLHAAWFEN